MVLDAFKKTREIEPWENNWVLFPSMIEAFILDVTGKCDMDKKLVVNALSNCFIAHKRVTDNNISSLGFKLEYGRVNNKERPFATQVANEVSVNMFSGLLHRSVRRFFGEEIDRKLATLKKEEALKEQKRAEEAIKKAEEDQREVENKRET